MTYPVHNQAVTKSNQTDPLEENYGYEYDPEMEGGEGDFGIEDEYVGEAGDGGDAAPLSATELRTRIGELTTLLKQNQQLSVEEKRSIEIELKNLKNQINGAVNQPAKLADIQAMLGSYEARILGVSEDGLEGFEDDGATPPPNLEEFKTELNTFKTEIDNAKNLSEDERTTLTAQVEKILHDIELAGTDPAKQAELDIDGMKSELEDMRNDLKEKDQFSPGVKSLADASELEPEVIEAKAVAKRINLDSPTMNDELINFLAEIVPDLKDKIEAVKKAVNDRQKFIDDNLAAAKSQNSSNRRCTSDVDKFDAAMWQNLYDLKYHQDEKSKAVMDAKKEVLDILTPILGGIFKDVKKVDPESASGWEATNNEYKVADQISIGGTSYDLFSNTDGSLNVSSSPDADADFTIPDIAFDAEGGAGEGGGEWYPKDQGLKTYGEGLLVDNYDSDDGY